MGAQSRRQGSPSNPEDQGVWGGGSLRDKYMGLELTAEGALAFLRAAAAVYRYSQSEVVPGQAALDGCMGPTERKTTRGWSDTSNRRETNSPNRRDNASWRD